MFYPVRLCIVLQVDAWDHPAVGGQPAAPQRPVKAVPLGALQDLQASWLCDLIDKPQAAPLTMLQTGTQQHPYDLSLWVSTTAYVVLLILIHGCFHCDKTAWTNGLQIQHFIHYKQSMIKSIFMAAAAWSPPPLLYKSLIFVPQIRFLS